MTTKEALHRLVDELPEEQLPAAKHVLIGLRDGTMDPFRLRLLTGPYDDEAETEDERSGAEEARAQIARGDFVTSKELRREIGW